MDRKCPYCDSVMPEEASFCLHCMRYISELHKLELGKKRKKNKAFFAMLITGVFVLALTPVLLHLVAKAPKNEPPVSIPQSTTAAALYEHTDAETSTVTTEEKTYAETTEATSVVTETTTQAAAPVTAAETSTKKETTTEKTTEASKQKTTTKKSSEKSPVISNGVLISYPKKSKAASYKIPYKVKSISTGALQNRYLTTLYFSKRENVSCDWQLLFSGLPNLQTIYIYPGTSVDLEGKAYFSGKIVYL